MTQPTALFLADILEDGGKPADIAEKCAAELRRLHAQIAACEPYLKEGETPAERIERDHKDSLALMTLLAREKTKNEATLREAATQALEALESAVEYDYHGTPLTETHAGFNDAATALRAALVEDAMQKFTDVSQEIEAALADPVAPVAWMHVPYPGNGMSPLVSRSEQREPSMYAASVPLYLKEQL